MPHSFVFLSLALRNFLCSSIFELLLAEFNLLNVAPRCGKYFALFLILQRYEDDFRLFLVKYYFITMKKDKFVFHSSI